MRFSIIVAALVATAFAIPTPVKQHAADQELLKKQQDIIYLLEQITERIPNQQYYDLGFNYDIENNLIDYSDPAIVQYYVGLVKNGHVQPQGTAFSTSVSQLRKEVSLLTRVLMSSKNYSVFLKTAAWARIYVNEEQFIKALISSILQYPETVGVIPPALYEILPQHYIDSRVIHEAQNVKILGVDNPLTEQTVVIPVNYTDYLPLGEHQLGYYTQDIGLSIYYAYVSLAGYMIPDNVYQHYQQGVEGPEVSSIGRGHIYYYLHQQLLAHYNLQRLANGLGPIEEFQIDHIETPYHPHLRHINGLEFPGRSDDVNLNLHHEDLVKNVYLLEKRILDAIDHGHVITPQAAFLSLYHPQGLNILGELIEGTGRSVNPRYYGSFQAAARQLLGLTPSFNNIWDYTPSALDVYETSVRDPAFYQLYKRVINIFLRYQESLPAYQYNDVILPGVSIEKIIFPELYTYYEQYLVDLDNSIVQPINKVEQENLKVKAQIPRLNHKPYEYQVIVNSEKPIHNAVVRVYLGPKVDYDGKPIDINIHRHYFVELDQFVYEIQQGKNVIVRDSQHAPHLSHDYPSIHHIRAYIDSAVRSQNPYYVVEPHQIFGYPARLAIPKGHYGGLPLQVLVVIHSSEEVHIPYGPVIPSEWQTYQYPHYKIVENEQYENIIKGQEQQPGLHSYVEVIPHFSHHGIYGSDVEKLKYYYGHYLYHKYPMQYPIPYIHSHYYGHGQVHVPVSHQGHVEHVQGHHNVHVPVSGQVYYGQHTQVPYVQTSYQGRNVEVPVGVVGSVESAVPVQGEHHHVHQEHVHYPHGTYQQGSVDSVNESLHHVEHGVYNVYKHNVEYLNNYYHGKHISEIIGGAISLDHKPLGWPLDRPLAPSVFYVPNIAVADVIVYHQDYPIAY